MKCTTCTQTDFESLHGRIFCANCGSEAAKRLQNFAPHPSAAPRVDKIGGSQVLDLSGQGSKPPKPQPPQGAVLDLSATINVTPSLTGISGAREKPSQNAQSLHARTPTPQNVTTPPPEAPPVPEPTPEQPRETAPAPLQPKEVTYMEPHQTYSLKDEVPEEQDPLADVAPTPPISPPVGQPQKQSLLQKLGLNGFFANKALRTSAIALSMVLLSGYVTYLNYPNITLRVAANRANIEAAMPGYVPGGYNFSGPIAHSPGQLVITFSDGEEGIRLSQSETRWDSRSLLENKIRLSTSTYDTYRENGLTIYTYEGRHAAWVNSGILYEIETDAPLDPEEIIRMASSL